MHGHEKLLAYQRALACVPTLDRIAREVPPPWADLRDQLRRAAASMPLNLAEGAGEFRVGEKARLYRIALRSGTECQAILDVLQSVGLDPVDLGQARHELREAIALTTRLVRAVEAR